MKKEDAIKYLQQLYPNGGHCWLDEQRIEAIDMAVKALQEEHVSEELEEAAFDYAEACKYDGGEKLLCVEHFKAGAKWGMNQAKVEIQSQSMSLANGCPKEPVSEELEEEIKRMIYDSYYDVAGIAIKGTSLYLKVDGLATIARHFAQWQFKRVNKALLSEVLPCFMNGGEADEVVAKLEEVLNKK